jgi:hypothetical protein
MEHDDEANLAEAGDEFFGLGDEFLEIAAGEFAMEVDFEDAPVNEFIDMLCGSHKGKLFGSGRQSWIESETAGGCLGLLWWGNNGQECPCSVAGARAFTSRVGRAAAPLASRFAPFSGR